MRMGRLPLLKRRSQPPLRRLSKLGNPGAFLRRGQRGNGRCGRFFHEISSGARATIRGAVKIDVLVDVNGAGNVVNARLSSPAHSRYFAAQTIDAARRWQFEPARIAGEWLLRFQVMKTQTKVLPVRVR